MRGSKARELRKSYLPADLRNACKREIAEVAVSVKERKTVVRQAFDRNYQILLNEKNEDYGRLNKEFEVERQKIVSKYEKLAQERRSPKRTAIEL